MKSKQRKCDAFHECGILRNNMNALITQGRMREAVTAGRLIIQKFPGDEKTWDQLADLYEQLGQPVAANKARSHINMAL